MNEATFIPNEFISNSQATPGTQYQQTRRELLSGAASGHQNSNAHSAANNYHHGKRKGNSNKQGNVSHQQSALAKSLKDKTPVQEINYNNVQYP